MVVNYDGKTFSSVMEKPLGIPMPILPPPTPISRCTSATHREISRCGFMLNILKCGRSQYKDIIHDHPIQVIPIGISGPIYKYKIPLSNVTSSHVVFFIYGCNGSKHPAVVQKCVRASPAYSRVEQNRSLRSPLPDSGLPSVGRNIIAWSRKPFF